ncbi:hypothetical protein KMW28_12760 [Flammeovirga yaeyamensis]|uniref:Cthe-2314-like HEPN domain-containing protein n=1 Tax=Flammeovirga yaeyamensis TaxID=367791 RepID=A0AAX1MYW3_9BACT|nr:hypothetical protein [Flammeovirga yaeyamensis]MBB3695960.1 hypothetical protein [Flammeovirga yaeyamensis]NMF34647.1 hypothetical protein [Flammeovirga yaeyamensis]QWG00524.1 hypothetical protein KMW28_12760 [Flammeovirga yaeyamensis]
MLTNYSNLNEMTIDLSTFKDNHLKEKEYLIEHIELCTVTTHDFSSSNRERLLQQIEEDPDKESELQELYEKKVRILNCHFFHSSIILIYALFENTLKELCLEIENQTSSPLSMLNLNGRTDILKFKSFFEITSDVGDLLQEFETFNVYRLLRNGIAHNKSQIRNNRDYNNMKNALETGIEYDDTINGFFIESSELPIEFLEKVSNFILSLSIEIESKQFMNFSEPSEEGNLPF